MSADEGVAVSTIVIRRVLDAEGHDYLTVEMTPDEIPLIEFLGLLEMAKGYETQSWREDDDEIQT